MAGAAAQDVGAEAPAIDAFAAGYVARYAARHIGKSRQEIQAAIEVEEAERAQALKDLKTRWRNERPAIVAADEAQRAGHAAARAAWLALGVKYLRWVTSGSDTCPYCRDLDGKTIGIQTVFIEAGREFEPTGADKPMKTTINIGHPPLHRGCNCGIVASRQ